jgi:hypothetical protein
MYREIIAVCSQIKTKPINTLCGQNVGLLNVKLAVHIVTAVRYIYIYQPLYGIYNDHSTVHILTAVRYILLPLCITHTDQSTLPIVTAVQYIY